MNELEKEAKDKGRGIGHYNYVGWIKKAILKAKLIDFDFRHVVSNDAFWKDLEI